MVLGPSGCDLLHRRWVFITGPAGVLGERGAGVGEEHIIQWHARVPVSPLTQTALVPWLQSQEEAFTATSSAHLCPLSFQLARERKLAASSAFKLWPPPSAFISLASSFQVTTS